MAAFLHAFWTAKKSLGNIFRFYFGYRICEDEALILRACKSVNRFTLLSLCDRDGRKPFYLLGFLVNQNWPLSLTFWLIGRGIG